LSRVLSRAFRILLVVSLIVPVLLVGDGKIAAYQTACDNPSPTWTDIKTCMKSYVDRPAQARTTDFYSSYEMQPLPTIDSSRFNRAVFAIEKQDGTVYMDYVNNKDLPYYKQWNLSTIFSVGSMSKPVLVVAVLKLIQDYPGEFGYNGYNINDALNRPAYLLPGLERLDDTYRIDGQFNPDASVKRSIKLIHLLTHTSGFMNVSPNGSPCSGSVAWMAEPGLTNECVYDASIGGLRSGRTAGTFQIAQWAMGLPLARNPNNTAIPAQPGIYYDGGFNYSNINQILLGALIEGTLRKNGITMTFNNYIKSRIFAPLGMTDSFFMAQAPPSGTPNGYLLDEGVTEGQRSRIADITLVTPDHNSSPGAMRYRPVDVAAPTVADDWGRDGAWDEKRRGWTFAWPEGGMYSTAGDLLKFLRMIKSGGLTSQNQRLLDINSASLLRYHNSYAPYNVWGITDRYYGFISGVGRSVGFSYKVTAGDVVDHTGQDLPLATVAHLGRFMTYFWVTPYGQLGVFLSQQLPELNRGLGNPNNKEQALEPIDKFTRMATNMQ
jgi:CubicO group peptidase (beta-lactamase class C family)